MVSFAFQTFEIMIIYEFIKMGDRFFKIHLSRLLSHLRSAVGKFETPLVAAKIVVYPVGFRRIWISRRVHELRSSIV